MKRKLQIVLIFLITLSACRTSELNDTNDQISKWNLWSNGTALRGVNIWQKKIDPAVDDDFIGTGEFGPEFTKEDFERIRSLGINYVNISHPGIYTVAYPYVPDHGSLNNLKDLINKIGEADMFAVISFRTGPGRSEYTFYYGEDFQSDPENGWFDRKYYNEEVWKSAEAQNGWKEMWSLTAKEFNNHPHVIGYDLMVEPNSPEVILGISEPSEFYPKYAGTLLDWNTLYPELISAIREIDKDTPVIVGASFYSNLEWLPYLIKLTDPKTIYSFHQYAPFEYTHQERDSKLQYPGTLDLNWDSIPDDFNREWLSGFLKTAQDYMQANNVVTTANEYGCVRWAGNAKEFLNDEMEIFESLGINYAIWAWSTGYEPYRSEIDGFNFLMGPDPENKDDIENNELMVILKSYWSKNQLWPSNTNFN